MNVQLEESLTDAQNSSFIPGSLAVGWDYNNLSIPLINASGNAQTHRPLPCCAPLFGQSPVIVGGNLSLWEKATHAVLERRLDVLPFPWRHIYG